MQVVVAAEEDREDRVKWRHDLCGDLYREQPKETEEGGYWFDFLKQI